MGKNWRFCFPELGLLISRQKESVHKCACNVLIPLNFDLNDENELFLNLWIISLLEKSGFYWSVANVQEHEVVKQNLISFVISI